jgi:hypothetical protein
MMLFAKVIDIWLLNVELHGVVDGLRPCFLVDHYLRSPEETLDVISPVEDSNLCLIVPEERFVFVANRVALRKKLEADIRTEASRYKFIEVSGSCSVPCYDLFDPWKSRVLEWCHVLLKQIASGPIVRIDCVSDELHLPTFTGWLLDMPYVYTTKTQDANCLSMVAVKDVTLYVNSRVMSRFSVPVALFDNEHLETHVLILEQRLGIRPRVAVSERTINTTCL